MIEQLRDIVLMRHNRTRNLFTIIFTPHTLIGCWLSAHPSDTRLHLRSFHKITCDHLELEHLYIFNPSRIQPILSSWYCATNRAMPVAYALLGPSLQEKIVSVSNSNPSPEQLSVTHSLHQSLQYSYLYSYQNLHYFYLCTLPRPLLLQYQLLSINAGLPVAMITTQSFALLTAYRSLFGVAYRPSQLAMALTQCNSIDQLFFRDDLTRLLSIPAEYTFAMNDYLTLVTSCGLFLQEGTGNEAH